uniref:Uncharacterized protein n=1 Tax=Arundo donax TaxID=35708 RepID=A0A0A9F363_ARUDO
MLHRIKIISLGSLQIRASLQCIGNILLSCWNTKVCWLRCRDMLDTSSTGGLYSCAHTW